jgi:hypothetical protein
MESSAHDLLSAWESFYVIAGSSAAALTGLQFVVIALIADTPELGDADSVDAFGTPTVVHFCLSLLVSALLSAPWPALEPVRYLLSGTGLAGVLYTLVVVRRARRQTAYQPVAEDWIWHVILPLLGYGTLIGAAVALSSATIPALFLVAGVSLLLIFIGIHNAWDTVAFVAVQHRAKSRG